MKINRKPRIVIVGSVNSSLQTVKKLIEYKCNLVAILGLDPVNSKNVSGYIDLKDVADKYNISFKYFSRINSDDIYAFLKKLDVDLFFVIGLSQMIKEPLLSLAKYGNIGFHPTKLPKGRGRGAVAWLILGKAPAAVSFFLMDEGMDSGAIIGQHEFEISDIDYAEDVIEKIKLTIDLVLDDLLPKLNQGELNLEYQDHSKATFLGQRKPADGRIDWSDSVEDIHRLIRATSNPLPGAYTIINGEKLKIWRASAETKYSYFGVPGRVLDIENYRILVACGNGALWIEKYEIKKEIKFRIGLDL